MEHNMKETGEMARPVDMECLITSMEIFMKGSSKMIKPMAEEAIIIKMVQNSRALGKMILNKATVEKNGKMALIMRDILTRV
jgi:hypothetical protein